MPTARLGGNVWTAPALPRRMEKRDGPAEPLRRPPACAAETDGEDGVGGVSGSGGPLPPFTSHADIMAAEPGGRAR